MISRFAAPSARLGQSGGHALGVRLERGVDREVEWREDAEGDDAGSATSSARHRILPDPLRQCCCRGVQAVDANRRGDFPNQSFDFLGFTFRARKALGRGGQPFACFLPAASPKALTSISRTVRRWALHHRSDKSLQDLLAVVMRLPTALALPVRSIRSFGTPVLAAQHNYAFE